MGRRWLNLHLAIHVACAGATSSHALGGNLSTQRRLMRIELARNSDDFHQVEALSQTVVHVARPGVLVQEAQTADPSFAPLLSVTPMVSDNVDGVLGLQSSGGMEVHPPELVAKHVAKRQAASSQSRKSRHRKRSDDVQPPKSRDRKEDGTDEKSESVNDHSSNGEASSEDSAVHHMLVTAKKEVSDAKQKKHETDFKGTEARASSSHVAKARASDGSSRRLSMRSSETTFSAVSTSVGAGILVVVLVLAAVAFGLVCYNKQQRTTQRRTREFTPPSPRRQSSRKSGLLSESRNRSEEADLGGVLGGSTDGGEADIDSSSESFRGADGESLSGGGKPDRAS